MISPAPAIEKQTDFTSQRFRMTYEEFLAWADEDVHAEWVDGEVIVQMPPKNVHQDVIEFVFELLAGFVRLFRLGKVRVAPFEMRARLDGPAREPDILFIASEHMDRLTEARLAGPADLIIEVVSADSVARDRADKFYEYQDAGVREYWILDPREGRERADFYVLDANGKYQPIPIGADGIYRSAVLTGFWLRVDWLWLKEALDPWRALTDIVGRDRIIAAFGG